MINLGYGVYGDEYELIVYSIPARYEIGATILDKVCAWTGHVLCRHTSLGRNFWFKLLDNQEEIARIKVDEAVIDKYFDRS